MLLVVFVRPVYLPILTSFKGDSAQQPTNIITISQRIFRVFEILDGFGMDNIGDCINSMLQIQNTRMPLFLKLFLKRFFENHLK